MSFTPVSSIAPATVTVAGTVAVSSVAGSVAVTGALTDTQLRASAVPVSGPLTDAQLRATRVPVDGSGVTQPVSGSVGVTNFPATQPVSAVALPLPTGAARDSTLTDGTQRVGGTVTVDASGVAVPVTGPLTNAQLRASAVPVDASSVAVPVTGPLTDAQLRASAVDVDGSAVTQPVSADTLPLPDGAATEDKQARELAALNDVALTAILERERLEVG